MLAQLGIVFFQIYMLILCKLEIYVEYISILVIMNFFHLHYYLLHDLQVVLLLIDFHCTYIVVDVFLIAITIIPIFKCNLSKENPIFYTK